MPVAEVLAKFAGAGGALIGEMIGSLTEDFVDAAGRLLRTDVGIKLDYVKNWVAEAFDSLVEEEPHPNIGMTPKGMVSVTEKMIKATAQIGLLLGTEAAEELFMELVQEGFSNAIQTSMGGAFQTMLNIFRGGAPPTPDELETVVGKVVDMDSDTLAFIIAATGSNLPVTFYRVSRGFDLFVQQDTNVIRQQLTDALVKLNHAISWVHELARELSVRELEEALSVIKEAYSKGISLLDSVAERALSRLQELKTELQTAKEWYNYTQLYPETPILTETDANMVAIENELEADATFSSYQALKSTIENTLANVDVDLQNIVDKIDSVIQLYVDHLNRFIEAGAVDYTEELDKIQEALQKVIAYRNAVENETTTTTPVEVVGETTTTTLETLYTLYVYA